MEDKGTCQKPWQAEFDPSNLRSGRSDPILTSCPLTSIHVQISTHKHTPPTHTHTPYMKIEEREWRERKDGGKKNKKGGSDKTPFLSNVIGLSICMKAEKGLL